MKTISTIGIDLAKNSFSVYGVNAKGKCGYCLSSVNMKESMKQLSSR
jgi:hypothetical protein